MVQTFDKIYKPAATEVASIIPVAPDVLPVNVSPTFNVNEPVVTMCVNMSTFNKPNLYTEVVLPEAAPAVPDLYSKNLGFALAIVCNDVDDPTLAVPLLAVGWFNKTNSLNASVSLDTVLRSGCP